MFYNRSVTTTVPLVTFILKYMYVHVQVDLTHPYRVNMISIRYRPRHHPDSYRGIEGTGYIKSKKYSTFIILKGLYNHGSYMPPQSH